MGVSRQEYWSWVPLPKWVTQVHKPSVVRSESRDQGTSVLCYISARKFFPFKLFKVHLQYYLITFDSATEKKTDGMDEAHKISNVRPV